jgi:hypothetical protein
MKKETVEEFLARGGIIQKIPAQVFTETPHLLKTSSPPIDGIMSLDDGAHYFAENRKTIKTTEKVLLKDVVDNFNLPKEVADRLRGPNVSR